MNSEFLFRNVFNAGVVVKLSDWIKAAYSEFNEVVFAKEINSTLETLSFGDRNTLIRDSLRKHLPEDVVEAITILVKCLPEENKREDLTGFDGFIIMPLCSYVAKFGLEHFDVSMNALYEMTKRFTAEGDIRPFIRKYPEQTYELLMKWTDDPNPHVRRLVSEGSRPRLPLGSRLHEFVKDPTPVIALLEKLKEDPALYVRRSVANNLNDIAKDNPEVVVETLLRWKKIKNPGTAWLVSHAARTLLKQGNKEALLLFGYDHKAKINANISNCDEGVVFGSNLSFSISLTSVDDKTQPVMIDYKVHFMKANGKTAPKVFKLSKKKLLVNETVTIEKSHSFKPISTRKYYPGLHAIEIVVNGNVIDKREFELKI